MSITSDLLLQITISVSIVSLISSIMLRVTKNRIYKSYQIAVVGFPQSGKTTLITTLLNEILLHNIYGEIIPRGLETIEKINRDIASIELGIPLEPTKNQDMFDYRIDLKRKKTLFSESFKVEIGDFPGENSDEFMEKYGPWFHSTTFFKWVMEADTYIFTIDTLKILLDVNGDYHSKISSAIRAAWQIILEHHFEGKNSIKHKKVIIVFTKADLLIDENEIKNLTNNGIQMPTGYPKVIKRFSINKFDDLKQPIIDQYSDLLNYFVNNKIFIQVLFVSYFAENSNTKMGLPKLAKFIMPW
jgi:GTPase SAR1 family protein